uniref:Uncharacterized protein n=1 Tax=Meloidogyne incognita TaxID=6306 RepID=A0A914N992_MELIC
MYFNDRERCSNIWEVFQLQRSESKILKLLSLGTSTLFSDREAIECSNYREAIDPWRSTLSLIEHIDQLEMDKTVPKFSEAIYEEVKRTFYNCLKNKKSFNITSVAFVPISGLEGDNILEPSDRMLWFKGWNIERKDGNANGKTLLEALKTIEL